MTEEILELVGQMGGQLPQGELGRLLCEAITTRLESQLRPGVTLEDCRPAFLTASAFLVLAALETGDGSGSVTSFSAGDVSIRQQTNGREGKLSAQAQALMVPYLQDTTFFLQEVVG